MVLATRLAVHGPISGPQASFPGMGGASGPLPSLVGATGPSIMVPTAARPSPNEPLGPVNLLGPLSAAGPYSGLFTGTRWKPFPEVPPDHTSANHLLLDILNDCHLQAPQCKRMEHTTSQRVRPTPFS